MALTKVSFSMIDGIIINVNDFGAVGDGVTDNADAIQAAIDSVTPATSNGSASVNREFRTYTLTGNGVYAVSETILLKNSINIDNLAIKALSGFTAGDPVLATDGNNYHGNINALTIDGNNQDVKGIEVSHVYRSRFTNLSILNCKRDSFTTNTPGYELFVDNFQIVASPDCDALAKGLVVNSGDGHFSNGTSVFTPIGVEVNGGANVFDRIHTWSGYYANGKDPGVAGGREQFVGFYVNVANNHFNMCQSDSPSKRDYSQGNLAVIGGYINGGVGFYVAAAAFRNKFVSCSLVINSTLYIAAAAIDGRPASGQIVPFAIDGGRDNAFIGFRNETKTQGAPAIYSSAAVQTDNTIVGCDGETNVIMSRVSGVEALILSAENDSTVLDVSVAGVVAGGIDAPNNFTTSYRAKEQFHIDLDDQTYTPAGLRYTTFASSNSERFAPKSDDKCALGWSDALWTVVYAATGSINTSDANEKQNIANFDDAEKRVATALKGLVKKFRFKSAVEQKGNDARIHIGVIAQDVKAAFEAEGLDPYRYGMFCSDTWTDEDGVERTRLGIRYEELLAFVVSAL